MSLLLIFLIYSCQINLPDHIAIIEHHAPRMNSYSVPLLLYTDDTVLLSTTKSGLIELLSAFADFCSKNDLTINTDKSKILTVSKSWKCTSWKINGKPIEQVKSFRYLGLLFHYKLNCSYHRKVADSLPMNQFPTLVHFHFHIGHQYVSVAVQVFQAKITNQLLFGVPVWITATSYKIDCGDALFLLHMVLFY